MNATSLKDLQWTASCYVLGELSAEETVRFEALLQDDQAARDAVAEAVNVLQMAASAPMHATASNSPAPGRSRLAVWASAVVALGLLAGVVVYLTPKSTELTDARTVDTNEAGDAWLLDLPQLLGEQAAVAESVDATEEADPFTSPEDTDGEVPDWLILATSRRETP